MRLANGNSKGEGRVEIFHNGVWGTVCDNNWDIKDGKVVCRELGFPGAHSAPRRAWFGEGTGSTWLDDVQCDGTESSIYQCGNIPQNGSLWTPVNCEHSKDASVICLRNLSMAIKLCYSMSFFFLSSSFNVSYCKR